jgi:hypothetical protein
MLAWRLTAWVLLVALAGVTPVASTSQLDPMPLAGIWDGAQDDDDPVAVGTPTPSGTKGSPVVVTHLRRLRAVSLVSHDASPPRGAPARSLHERAPPALRSAPLI